MLYILVPGRVSRPLKVPRNLSAILFSRPPEPSKKHQVDFMLDSPGGLLNKIALNFENLLMDKRSRQVLDYTKQAET